MFCYHTERTTTKSKSFTANKEDLISSPQEQKNTARRGKLVMPGFLTRKEVYDWIKTKRKTIELRKGNPRKGEEIVFLSGRNEWVKGKILRKREGPLDELLTASSFKKIVPIARSLDEAKAFMRKIYPTTEGTFTSYEFELETK